MPYLPLHLYSFNPRSRGGSDDSRRGMDERLSVSIHAPAGGATPHWPASNGRLRFQSTLPRGERPPTHCHNSDCVQFQSTLPRGERLRPRHPVGPRPSFNPRSRGGSDHERAERCWRAHVSIHAPAGGATRNVHGFCERLCFNPRSRGGSDKAARLKRACFPGFNPRSRGGSDSPNPLMRSAWGVSIHAPAGGATISAASCKRAKCFNPRSRGGSDAGSGRWMPARFRFNPRSRGGSDVSPAGALLRRIVSIHAPAGGATLRVCYA